MRGLSFALLVTLTAILLAPAGTPEATARQPAPRPGLTLRTINVAGQALLVVTSTGRFELHLGEGGIVAWYDLRRDPDRTTSLVAPGQTLVAHLGPAGETLRAPWRVEIDTPVLARVVWRGVHFTRSYTIWAAGQVAIATTGEGAPMTLARRPGARTGAALQDVGPGAATLFLDAWTGEDRPATSASLGGAGLAMTALAAGGTATVAVPAAAGLRAPRLAVERWPGPAHTLRQGATLLVEGQDYLAHWDRSTRTLYAQVFAALPPGGATAGRTFSFVNQVTPGLSLGVQGRTLSPEGLLQVDGNMPDNSGERSTYDLFFIPYIQATPVISLTGVFQGTGAGVEFVLNGESRTVFGATGDTLLASFTLPVYGEYRAEGYIVDASGRRLGAAPDDVIDPLGIGRIAVTIGDSITGGSNGDAVRPGEAGFPVTSYLESPAASEDRRNFFQFDNRNFYGATQAAFQRGYQLSLNNLLTACGGDPVFILNSGYGGLRLSYKRDDYEEPPNNSALAKLPAYLDQIEKLGARYLLVMLGTNDAMDGQARSYFREDLGTLISALRGETTGTHIWVARVPYSQFLNIADPDLVAARQSLVEGYNREIVNLVDALDTPGIPVRPGPDFYSYFAANQALLDDGTHPTQAGYEAMAGLWAGQSLGLEPLGGLPCEVFAAEGDAPPPPGGLVPRSWLPGLAVLGRP